MPKNRFLHILLSDLDHRLVIPRSGKPAGALVLAVAALVCAGCLEALEPDIGPPVREPCTGEDSDPYIDVSFRRDIMARILAADSYGCLDCHSSQGRTPLGLDVGGLDLSSYQALRRGGAVLGPDIVIPGQPCASGLLDKLSSVPPAGARMPLGGPPFVSEQDRQLISDWIAEGARDN